MARYLSEWDSDLVFANESGLNFLNSLFEACFLEK